MNKILINPRTNILAIIILSAGIWRLCITSSHSSLTNFTPIGAMALFGGCYFADKWKAFVLPLLTLWLSDLLLSYFVYFHEWKWFYSGFYITYGAFMLIVLMGRFIKKVNVRNILVASILAALTHWLITDFGVWMDGRLYPKNMEGLITCYVAALPYVENMMIGNLVFGAIMFGSFELAQKKYPQLQLRNV
ncbi:MAG TPA: DUF6580 family putative transport protein [Bacteroidia bacterium]|nr:DUF6580 family putative transport protein [Bacteroidia bacterium]